MNPNINGEIILPDALRQAVKSWERVMNTRQGARLCKSREEAVFLNKRASIGSENNPIIKAAGRHTNNVSFAAMLVQKLALFVFFTANAPAIMGRMLTPNAPKMPTGR